MADFDAQFTYEPTYIPNTAEPCETNDRLYDRVSGAGASYVMRARDAGRSAGSDYIVWKATTPDFAGGGYATGSPTPIGAMVVGSVVVQSTLT